MKNSDIKKILRSCFEADNMNNAQVLFVLQYALSDYEFAHYIQNTLILERVLILLLSKRARFVKQATRLGLCSYSESLQTDYLGIKRSRYHWFVSRHIRPNNTSLSRSSSTYYFPVGELQPRIKLLETAIKNLSKNK